jgi:hypothetical protein
MSDASLYAQPQESFFRKLILLVLDKLVFAVVVAILVAALTYASTLFSDRLKTVWNFQEKLFDRRLEAYSELQRRAEDVLVSLAVYYPRPSLAIAFDPWPDTLSRLKKRWEVLSGVPSSGISGGPFSSVSDVLQPLKTLVDSKRHYEVLITGDLDDTVNNFIRKVTTIIDAELSRAEQEKENKSPGNSDPREVEEKQRWMSAFIAYKELNNHLRSTLGLDLTPAQTFVFPNYRG